jgi:hypothetical protein
MTSEQGMALGLIVVIGYGAWLLTALLLYRTRRKVHDLEAKIRTLERE